MTTIHEIEYEVAKVQFYIEDEIACTSYRLKLYHTPDLDRNGRKYYRSRVMRLVSVNTESINETQEYWLPVDAGDPRLSDSIDSAIKVAIGFVKNQHISDRGKNFPQPHVSVNWSKMHTDISGWFEFYKSGTDMFLDKIAGILKDT